MRPVYVGYTPPVCCDTPLCLEMKMERKKKKKKISTTGEPADTRDIKKQKSQKTDRSPGPDPHPDHPRGFRKVIVWFAVESLPLSHLTFFGESTKRKRTHEPHISPQQR